MRLTKTVHRVLAGSLAAAALTVGGATLAAPATAQPMSSEYKDWGIFGPFNGIVACEAESTNNTAYVNEQPCYRGLNGTWYYRAQRGA
ncbi:non-hemolytic enterotoxin B (plasmid) [Gordonia rubripertincta]|uniref:Non-hemolytic enterotoxin B n=1 Tax=Gordonia rubripertincta TaxID=36822 RepID=A0AAW6RFZ1_GORRU|nr:non-hemolytic enterotoxin B [Gordonia rubripertincta]MCZ4537481.1 non-hemolytic enterotoxin B [Gordonia terrae]MDG6782937.1 non-hemolytic enterotoxin B [Gordonia rubripertincta]